MNINNSEDTSQIGFRVFIPGKLGEMAQKRIEKRLDITDSKLEGIKKVVQKLLEIKRSLAKLSQTSDETLKALAAIASEMSYWRTQTPGSMIVDESGQKSKEEKEQVLC